VSAEILTTDGDDPDLWHENEQVILSVHIAYMEEARKVALRQEEDSRRCGTNQEIFWCIIGLDSLDVL
jgi:hypothetical protein